MTLLDNTRMYLFKTIIYVVCITFGLMSILPFYLMFVNATRSTNEIFNNNVTLIPSTYFADNLRIMNRGAFDAMVGFKNSMTVSVGATVCAVYFSSLTAYGLVAYDWKLRRPFFTFILFVLMVPAQVTTIGFFQFMWRIGLVNNFIPLILPAIASPAIVFFMRQYLLSTLSLEIVDSARIDGSGEFSTFNKIILPIMKPAIATQAIFVFVASWNALFLPMVLLTDTSRYTMPIMVTLLRGDIYRTELGAIYLGLSMTVIPLFILYFSLSKFIIAGVQLGGIKE